MEMKLKIARNTDKNYWNKLVESSRHGTIFHLWEWLKIIERYTQTELYPIIGFNGGEAVGIYPLFYKKSHLMKIVFSPPPHVAIPYLGPVLANYEHLKTHKRESVFIEFQKKVDEFIFSVLKANYVSIITSPGLSDSRPFILTDYEVLPVYNYEIDLTKGKEYIWKNLKKKLRRDIQRSLIDGISIECGTKKDLENIYELVLKRYSDQNNVVAVRKEYMLDVYKVFNSNIKITVVKYHGKTVTGLINILYGKKVISWIGSPKPEFRDAAFTDLMHWESLKSSCDAGFKEFEELGANTERLCKYKSKFNMNLSIHFFARKYSSFTPKVIEYSYKRILKPIRAFLKLRGM